MKIKKIASKILGLTLIPSLFTSGALCTKDYMKESKAEAYEKFVLHDGDITDIASAIAADTTSIAIM